MTVLLMMQLQVLYIEQEHLVQKQRKKDRVY